MGHPFASRSIVGVDTRSLAVANRLQRLRLAMEVARANNPYSLATMASPPTVEVSATSDATLGAAVPLAAANALLPAASRVAFYGGLPKANGKYILMPVASVLPSNQGNLLGYKNDVTITGDLSAWCNALEIVTDAPVVEFGLFMNSAMRVMLQVDGQYVDKVGLVGAQAGGTDNFVKLTFTSRKTRRIRVMQATRAGAASGSTPFQIRLSAGCSFWKPDQSGVLRLAWAGDSYGEGVASAYTLPNGPMAQIAGELLGFRDVRQVSVGGTGYTSVGAGRSKLRDQISRWLDSAGSIAQGPFDAIVVAHGYNDYAVTGALVTAEALLCFKLIRSLAPTTPIIVLGCQTGARNNDAKTLEIEAGIAAAVAQFADPLCKFVPVSSDPSPWLFGTGKVGATNGSGNSDAYVDPDGVHPSAPAGHEYLGMRAAAAIRTAVAAMAA